MPITSGQGNPDWTRDETILAMDLLVRRLPRVPDQHDPEVEDLSSLLRAAPIHPPSSRNVKFRNPAGVGLKLHQLNSLEAVLRGQRGLRPTKTDRAVWDEFKGRREDLVRTANAIRGGLRDLGPHADVDAEVLDEEELPEGKVLTAVHKRRERQRGFRRRVLDRNVRLHGALICETCERPVRLGGHGRQVEEAEFEVHHIVPLAEAQEIRTKLRDLVLLCANCHRLIHALARSTGHCLSMAEFRLVMRAE